MCNVVTERYIHCVEMLKDRNEIKSIRQFAISVDYHPQNMNDIMKGKRDVTIELIKNTIEIYRINANFIFSGQGSPFDKTETTTPVTFKESKDHILHVPVSAYAGYTEQFHDHVFLDDLVSFSLPDYKFRSGSFRCFDIAGDSMEPTLFAGEKVVCSYVDSNNYYSSVRNNLVYIVVLDGSIVVKRVHNKIKTAGILTLISDNNFYDPFDVSVNEIKEIWHVEVKISPFLPSPNNIRNAFHEEMDDMKKIIDQQSRSILTLNQTVERLLKQNRALV